MIYKKGWLLLLLVLLVSACGPKKREADVGALPDGPRLNHAAHEAFFNGLSSLNGKSFAGREVYMIDENESWAHLDFIIHMTQKGRDSILIPFHLSEDHSRTWLFFAEEGRLRFRHDHRLEDGTPDEISLYGGYATENGTAFVQHFPADDYTCNLIPYACNNEWVVEISADHSVLTYKLLRAGVLRFEAAFDLTKTVRGNK